MEHYLAGLVSGICQTLIGHPLDSYKTWRQNSSLLQRPSISFHNLYKGVKYPLIQSPFICGIGFGVYNNVYQETKNTYIAGSLTGFISALIGTPLDYYKIQRQQQLIDAHWRKSYRNMHSVILREIPANTIYFTTYDLMKRQDIPTMLSGSIAGSLSWLITYPLDTIKTRMQSGVSTTIRETINQGNLWVGLKPCIIRAFFVNGIGFYVYEQGILAMKPN